MAFTLFPLVQFALLLPSRLVYGFTFLCFLTVLHPVVIAAFSYISGPVMASLDPFLAPLSLALCSFLFNTYFPFLPPAFQLYFSYCRRGRVRLPDEAGVPAPLRGCTLSLAVPLFCFFPSLLSRPPGIALRLEDRLITKKTYLTQKAL